MLFSDFILGTLNLSELQKDEWAATINSFQDAKTGWYRKFHTLHYKEHSTAYAIAALTLIDRKHLHPLKFLDPIIQSQKSFLKWIKHISWSLIWPGSHVISGIPACMIMTDPTNTKYQTFYDWYFSWLEQEVDKNSGYWSRGLLHKFQKIPTHRELGGAFHMYYVYEALQKKWAYPQKIIDHTLRLQHENGLWDKEVTYCLDLDGIYSLTRSCRNSEGYRQEDIDQAVDQYLVTASDIFNDEEFFFKHYKNSHILPGALSAIAECQKFYPQLIQTSQEWEQSLDKACFI